MKQIEYWLKRNRRRITFGRFLSRAADSLAAFLFLFGAMVLGVRMILPAWWPGIGWLALLEIPMLLAAFWYAMIVRPKAYEADAALDERLQAGGLLMSMRETGDTTWARAIDQSPKQWKDALAPLPWIKCGKALVLPAVFAAAACMLPGRSSATGPVLRNTVGRAATGELQTILQQLSSSNLVDSSRTSQMTELVRQLVGDSETQPLTNQKWGVIDSVRDAMQMELDSSSMSAGNALSLLQSLQKQVGETGFDPSQLANGTLPTADQIQKMLGGINPQQTEQLFGTLSGLMKTLSQNGTNESLPPEVRQLLKEVMVDGELQLPKDVFSQLAMLNKMGGMLQQENNLLTDVRDRFLSGESSWTELGGSLVSQMMNGESNAAGVESTGIDSVAEALQSVFGNESADQESQFDQVTVTAPERQRNPEIVVPQVPTAGSLTPPQRNAARDFSGSDGNERWSRRFRPRHRQVVERYFTGQN